jgi:fluoride ion exporter CrcB/FEX
MSDENDFEQMARNKRESSFIGELWTLMREKKKYWLMPIIVVLLLLGLLVFLSGTAVAPFIYTLF